MRIGAKLPNSGPLSADPGACGAARAAGFDSLWVSDHVVMPETIARTIRSRPRARDMANDTPYVEALVALALRRR